MEETSHPIREYKDSEYPAAWTLVVHLGGRPYEMGTVHLAKVNGYRHYIPVDTNARIVGTPIGARSLAYATELLERRWLGML